MKTILISVTAGTLLAMLAVGQAPLVSRHSAATYSGSGHEREDFRSSQHGLLAYVITGGGQFGAVDLKSGKFLPIGPGTPPDVGGGLVQGPGRSLLTLAFSGNLDAIDPRTGASRVIGATGLGDCSAPGSPCGPNSANGIGRLGDTLYATDFNNTLYTIDPATAKAKMIGPTGMPALPFVPGPNPNGTINVFDETLFAVGRRLYADFGAAILNPDGPPAVVVAPAIYEINPRTGQATFVTSTELGLLGIVTVNDTVFAFSVQTGQVVTVDVRTGKTKAVSDLDPDAGLISGATPVDPEDHDRP